MFTFAATPPLSLYIHIPWCVRKCPYCDFNSHEVREQIPEKKYIRALIDDLEQDLPAVWGRTIETIFIGGGTPSLFTADAISQLLSDIRARIPLKPGAEVTLEANPGTVEQKHFEGFREAGINRLSIGVQSFQADLLRKIGRIHDDSEAVNAIDAAHRAGFDNVNLDLMFGLPGQTTDQALADLRTAMELRPEHISWYELTIEPNTWFHRHPPEQPDDALLLTMQETGRELLEQGGYARYEVSAFSLPDKQCRHNLNYWTFGDYLGIGAGAHAKITDAASSTISRTSKVKHPRAYLDSAQSSQRIGTTAALTPDDVTLEFAMNALRLDQGFSIAEFTSATGLPWSAIEETVNRLVDDKLLSVDSALIKTTIQGQRYLNELLQRWLPEPSSDAETG